VSTSPRTSCPPPDRLERALSGESDADALAHARSCPACREQARQIRANLDFMSDLVDRLGPDALASAARPLPVPESMPGYQLVRELARGGQGAVYEAVQLDTKRRVALKIIETGAPGRSARRRLEREAELASSLRHPSIVSIYQSLTLPDGRLALAMEFVDGVTLDAWAQAVDADAPPTPAGRRDALRSKVLALASMCDAVQHAHVHGVIHRDLKPGNVLVASDGAVRVVDFGIARRVSHATQITRTGSFAGTLAYASPEQVSGRPDSVDTRTDVYSLGLMLYELLAGRRPYETDGSLTGAVANIVSTTPPPLARLQPGDVPAGGELEAIVAKALAKEPERRYQSAAALKGDLDNWLAGRAVEARLHSTIYVLRKLAAKHRVAFSAAFGLVLLLAAFAVAMAWSSRRLAHQRTLLAEALSSSTIERGRSVARSGENARAEALIWPELMALRPRLGDPGLPFESPPLATQAAWALFELHAGHPSVTHVATLERADPIRFERDGSAVRVMRTDGASELRDVTSGRLLEASPPVADAGPQDRILVTGGRFTLVFGADRTIAHDATGGPSLEFSAAALAPRSLVDVSADGSKLLSIDAERRLLLSTCPDLRPIATLAESVPWFARPVFSPDGRTVIAGINLVVRSWSALDGAPLATWTLPRGLRTSHERLPIGSVRMSRDARMLAVGIATNLLLYDARDPGAAPREFRAAHRGFISSLAFSDDGSTLLSHGSERNSPVWDTAAGRAVTTFEHGQLRAIPILSADGAHLAVCDAIDSLRVYSTRPNEWRHSLAGPTDTVHRVVFAPDGSALACAASDGRVRVWRAADRSLALESDRLAESVQAVVYAPDGASLIAAGTDGSLHLLEPGGAATRLATGPPVPTWLGFRPGGGTLAVVGSAPDVWLLALDAPDDVARLSGHDGRVVEGAFSPDGRSLYTVGADGVCIAWDLNRRVERLRTAPVGIVTRSVAISPGGDLIATGSDDWKIRLYDARTGQLTSTLGGAKQQVFGLAFHPAGNILFSCGRDPVVQAWAVRTGRELAQLEGHEDLVLSLALSPEGSTLATASADRTIGLWDLGFYARRFPANASPWRPPTPPR